jgi:hypothetical protein
MHVICGMCREGKLFLGISAADVKYRALSHKGLQFVRPICRWVNMFGSSCTGVSYANYYKKRTDRPNR